MGSTEDAASEGVAGCSSTLLTGGGGGRREGCSMQDGAADSPVSGCNSMISHIIYFFHYTHACTTLCMYDNNARVCYYSQHQLSLHYII